VEVIPRGSEREKLVYRDQNGGIIKEENPGAGGQSEERDGKKGIASL